MENTLSIYGCRNLLLASTLVCVFVTNIFAAGTVVVLPGQKVFFTVEPGYTRIEYGREILFLDYLSSRLFRIDIKTDRCEVFPFAQPIEKKSITELDSKLWEKRSMRFAEVELRGERGKAEIAGFQCVVKRLLFGPKMMQFRTVRTPELSRYGQIFSPGIVDYWVQPGRDNFSRFQKIAKYNEQFYKNFPLLRQIDILGLLDFLGGIPLQRKSGSRVEELLQFKVLPAGEVRKSLPDDCQVESN